MTQTALSRGIDAFRAGLLDQAEHHLRAALAEPGATLMAAFNLGVVLMHLNRPGDAVEPLTLATRLAPRRPDSWAALAQAAMAAEQFAAAAAAFAQLARLTPADAAMLRHWGEALYRAGDFDAAEPILDRAETIGRDGPTRMLLGHCARRHHDYRRAIDHYQAALATLAPDSLAARTSRWMLGISLLALGDFDRGWAEMEARLSLEPLATPHARWNARMPEWDGELRPGLRLVIHYEQGFGDTLHFVRYLPILRARGLHVTLVAQKALSRLLRRQGTALADAVLDESDPVPPGDAHLWLMSVPDRLRPLLGGTIPTDTPYILPDPTAREAARRTLTGQTDGRPAIGLVWAGNPRHGRDRSRSIPYGALGPLLDLQSARFFSFQMGPARDEYRAAPHPNLIDATEGIADFDDTAAALAALDGFVTVDSAPAHLAGAMNLSTAVLVARDHDWRWGEPHLLRSPWYPGMVLYRQARDLDWKPELGRLASRLNSGSAFLNQF